MVVMTPRELMTDYLAAAKRGDWDTAFGFFAEDIVIHIPGRSFAGDRRGRDAAVGYIRAVRDRYRDGRIELELIDMLASEERVAVLVRERFHGDGPAVEIRRANVYRVRGGLIVEVSIFEADQYVVRGRAVAWRGERSGVNAEVPEPNAEDFEAFGVYDPDAPHAAERVELLRYLVGLGVTADVVGRGRRRRLRPEPASTDHPTRPGHAGGALPLRDAMTHAGSPAGSGCEPWGELDHARASLRVQPRAACTLSDVRGECVAVVDRVFGTLGMHPRVRSA
jgi:ketosteroid isomerase-like protein